MLKNYIKYAISSAIAFWLTDKIMDTFDGNKSNKKH